MNSMIVSKSKTQFVLNLAINGMVPMKSMTPYVPISPNEVLADIEQCMSVGGFTYIHLHARDLNGEPTGDAASYEKFIAVIRERYINMPICVSCSGRKDPSFEKRSAVLDIKGDLKPDMASLTLSSLNFSDTVSVNSRATIIRLAEKMQENEIVPELEIFDLGMMNFAEYLISKGYLKPPYYFNFMLGNIFSAQSKLSHLAALLAELPKGALWSVAGIGQAQISATLLSLSQGGGVRTGIEDTIWFDSDKTIKARNCDLIERVHSLASLADMEIMPCEVFGDFLKSK